MRKSKFSEHQIIAILKAVEAGLAELLFRSLPGQLQQQFHNWSIGVGRGS